MHPPATCPLRSSGACQRCVGLVASLTLPFIFLRCLKATGRLYVIARRGTSVAALADGGHSAILQRCEGLFLISIEHPASISISWTVSVMLAVAFLPGSTLGSVTSLGTYTPTPGTAAPRIALPEPYLSQLVCLGKVCRALTVCLRPTQVLW